MTTPIPTLQQTSSPGDVLRGLSIPFRALTLLFATPRLRRLAIACALVTGLTLSGVAFGAWRLADGLSAALVTGESGWQHAAAVGLSFVLFLLFFVVGSLTAPNLLLAPLQDPISEATEAACGDFEPAPFSLVGLVRGTAVSLQHTLTRLAFMALGIVALFPLNLVPVVGSVVYFGLSSTWTMFWIAVEHLSNPMARHLRPFREVVSALRKRLPLALGFGAALWVLLWVPILNFFLMPVAVIAGTLLFRGLRQAGALGNS